MSVQTIVEAVHTEYAPTALDRLNVAVEMATNWTLTEDLAKVYRLLN